MVRSLFILFVFLLSSCAMQGVDDEKAPLVLKPASFSSLPGWGDDDAAEALPAFRKSCARILKQSSSKAFDPDGIGGVFGDWQTPCREAAQASSADVRKFFETWFSPWQATAAGQKDDGLFTGYYEAALRGAKTRGGSYQTPLLARPSDLVMVDLGLFRDELKGQRIAGRVIDGYLKPYEDRKAIEGGALAGKARPLVWVDDPVDAFFLHVQGSGRVELAEGGSMRVGFDGQNGHSYYAIGRELIKRGELGKDNVSMQAIRTWLAAHPDQAAELMNTNRSYVFFKSLDGEEPLGGENVALTPGRSLAVDRSKIPYGVPVWLDIEAQDGFESPLRRLMVAQDTGGAIRGAVRGDVFWGHGSEAEENAGKMKARGRYWLLLPRSLTTR